MISLDNDIFIFSLLKVGYSCTCSQGREELDITQAVDATNDLASFFRSVGKLAKANGVWALNLWREVECNPFEACVIFSCVLRICVVCVCVAKILMYDWNILKKTVVDSSG